MMDEQILNISHTFNSSNEFIIFFKLKEVANEIRTQQAIINIFNSPYLNNYNCKF